MYNEEVVIHNEGFIEIVNKDLFPDIPSGEIEIVREGGIKPIKDLNDNPTRCCWSNDEDPIESQINPRKNTIKYFDMFLMEMYKKYIRQVVKIQKYEKFCGGLNK